MGRLVACSARISVDTHTHTDRTTTVTLAAHARRGLIIARVACLFAEIIIAVFVEGYFLHYFLVCDTLAGTPPICLYVMFQG